MILKQCKEICIVILQIETKLVIMPAASLYRKFMVHKTLLILILHFENPYRFLIQNLLSSVK